MDITKLRSDKVGEGRVQDSKSTGKSKGASSVATDGLDIGSSKPTSNTAEKVNFSPEASLLMEGLHDARQAPDVRTDKVAALKAQVKSGQYKVDAKAVADKMLQSGVEENSTRRS